MTPAWRLAVFGLLAACASPPPPAPPATRAPTPATAGTPAARPNLASASTRLRNGAKAIVQEAPGRATALLQVGCAGGAVLLAPGAAELTLQVLADAGDAASGRAPLRRRIEQLGGVLQTHVGPLTCWLDIRVEASAWPAAAQAVAETLGAPPPTRAEFERVRRELVAARTAAMTADPAGTMARLLLLGERDTDDYLRGLVDRDASDAATLLARGWRPESATVVLVAPTAPADALAVLDATDATSIGSWRAAAAPGPLPLIERRFESGLWWSPAIAPTAPDAPCQIAVAIPLPDVGEPGAGDEALALGCLTLEGVGGRLERVFADRGLDKVTWQATTIATPDATALVLRTEAPSGQIGAIWRALTAARASLQSVPPSPAELGQAQPHAPLLARLALLDDGARARRLAGDATGVTAVDRRLDELAGVATAGPDGLRQGVDRMMSRPFACVVVGGTIASDVPGVRAFGALSQTSVPTTNPPGAAAAFPALPLPSAALPTPPGTAPIAPMPSAPTRLEVAATAPGPDAAARPQPWLDHAAAEAGGAAALRRLHGWRSRATVRHDRAPEMLDEQDWRGDGALVRTKTVFGQAVVTRIAGDAGTERLGETSKDLDAAAIAAARHEMRRHPLALLAAHVRGELTFRTVTTREAGDRKLVILETGDGGFERLRVHIDAESHLVRAVESWATMPDGGVVHLHEAWQDHRPVGVLRAPFHRLTTQDDGGQRTATTWTDWQPVFVDQPR
jgi:hypothetical protein